MKEETFGSLGTKVQRIIMIKMKRSLRTRNNKRIAPTFERSRLR